MIHRNSYRIRKVPLLFLGIFFISLSTAFTSMLKVSALTNETPAGGSAIQGTTRENDMKRRKLLTFKTCLTIHMNFDDGRFTSFGDFFQNDRGSEEVIIAGFDRNSNAAITCKTATTDGMEVLKDLNLLPSNIRNLDPEFAFEQYITGVDMSDGFPPDGINVSSDIPDRNRDALKGIIDNALASPSLRQPGEYLKKERMFKGHSLIEMCYEVEEATPLRGVIDNEYFEIELADGTNVRVIRRDDGEVISRVKNAGYIDEGSFNSFGTTTKAKIGDVDLGFVTYNGYAGDNDFNAYQNRGGNPSRFYPIGNDIPEAAEFDNGIVTCEYVEQNKDWLRNNVVFRNGTLVLQDENGTDVNTPGQDDADQEAPPSCESQNTNIVINWLVCGLVQFIDDSVQQLGSLVDDLLNIDDSRYNNRQLRRAWSYTRNIASFSLIIIGLIMIIGQAVSKE